ncbi:MAG: DUF1501 domain-containing protein [Bryobacterales bacterium]|nr:DUF1501 domain-containing protein [Bryobacterales bacterium]
MTSRRKFLRLGCCSLSTLTVASQFSRLGLLSANAQTTGDYKALVCIFLFGGNDSNNMVVPISTQYAQYAQVRGPLAIPQAQLLQVPTPGGAVYGLHPSLAAMHPLWAQNKLAIAANVGMIVKPTTRAQYLAGSVPVPSNLFSHSDQTSEWQTAMPLGGTTGWGGRIADRLGLLGVNAPSNYPLGTSVAGGAQLLNGVNTKPATVIPGQTTTGLEGSNPDNAAMMARDKALGELLEMDAGYALIQAASANTKEGIRIAALINSATQANPLQTQFPNTGLGTELAQIARLIQVRNELGMRRQIFFAGLGGFDTHSNQLPDQQNLYTQLSQAMAAFYNATAELGVAAQVTTFTESEFGRTFQPSAGNGSDHAWGSHHFVMGGAVKGGNLYGTFPTLALQGPDDSGNRGNWIPTTSLDQYGATLAAWFGVPGTEMPIVFPNLANFTTQNVGFLE